MEKEETTQELFDKYVKEYYERQERESGNENLLDRILKQNETIIKMNAQIINYLSLPKYILKKD